MKNVSLKTLQKNF